MLNKPAPAPPGGAVAATPAAAASSSSADDSHLKCYHSTSKAVAPREFGHLDAAVSACTQLMRLHEQPEAAIDVAAKQRLAQCNAEIDATKRELAQVLEAIQKLEGAGAAAPASGAASAAAAPDQKS